MTDVGRRPRLEELLAILHTMQIVNVRVMDVDNPESPDIEVTLRFAHAALKEDVPDWAGMDFKPRWLFEGILEELQAWLRQRIKEEQWASKEDRFGAGIEAVMAYWTAELKGLSLKNRNLAEDVRFKFLSNTILRLQELLERRQAGGVYSRAENKREKARKTWAEEEFEGPKREEEQRRQREQKGGPDHAEPGPFGFGTFADYTEFMRKNRSRFEDLYQQDFEYAFYHGAKERTPPPPPNTSGKKPWYEVLGVAASASKNEITKAYRKLVKQHQPRTIVESEDKERAARMAEINVARDEGLMK